MIKVARGSVLGVILLAAWITGNHLVSQLFYVLLAVGVLSWLWGRQVHRHLVLQRLQEGDAGAASSSSSDGPVYVGDSAGERYQLSNRGRWPAVWAEVDDHSATAGPRLAHAVTLRGRRYKRWTVERRYDHRGLYQSGPLTVRVGDPFGFFSRSRVALPARSVLVYPRLQDCGRLGLGTANSAGQTAHRGSNLDQPPDASGIREYNQSDSAGRIHWPHSLRSGRLMVKNFELQHGADLWLLLDLEADAGGGDGAGFTLECAVSLAGSVARQALLEGRAVGLMASDSRSSMIPPGRGLSHLHRLLDYLAVCQADGEAPVGRLLQTSVPRMGRESVLALITAAPPAAWLPTLADVTRGDRRSLAFTLHLAGEEPVGAAATLRGRIDLHPVLVEVGTPMATWRFLHGAA